MVLFEPSYDSSAAAIELAGAARCTAVLRFPDFAIDEAELRAAFSERTKLVLLNTPHNPARCSMQHAVQEVLGLRLLGIIEHLGR